jgi:anhydro-N-acetylmuramic acid kinase
MSGTSLDGLDMVYVKFFKNTFSWQYQIIDAQTCTYPEEVVRKLTKAHTYSVQEICLLDYELAVLWSEWINAKKYPLLDCIASHGHTVLHAPQSGYTLQIGNPAYIAATTKTPVIADFRRGDVALLGNGAPLVPFGEKHLFDVYHYPVFLNLGGIANYSFHNLKNNLVTASDIVFVNIVLNDITMRFFKQPYDHNGDIAKNGSIIPELMQNLEKWGFLLQNTPKSLGREQYEAEIKPILEPYFSSGAENVLHTYCHFVTQTIVESLKNPEYSQLQVFVTGGGGHNHFLMYLLQNYGKKENIQFILPELFVIDYKEALIFAFLGLMRWLSLPNTLPTVTGAKKSISGGAIWLP